MKKGRPRKYQLNESTFDTIDSNDKAYWLGFIAADGCVTDRGDLLISLAKKDEKQLHKLLDFLKSDNPIRNCGNYVRIDIRSKLLVSTLISHGITPRKTHTLTWPSIEEKLVNSFVRGVVDGDGCIYWPAKNPKVTITGNYDFIIKLQEKLIHYCAVSKTKLAVRNITRKNIVTLEYCGIKNITKILNWCYQECNDSVCLDRKYSKVKELLRQKQF